MKSRVLLRAILSVMLLLLAAGPGLASGSLPTVTSKPLGPNAGPAAPGEWVIETVDASSDVGSHVSIATSGAGTTHISYYDAGLGHLNLKMATYVGSGGNCGTDNRWSCETVMSDGDVGQFSSIATTPRFHEPIVAYYDATAGAVVQALLYNDIWYPEVIYYTLGGHTSMRTAEPELGHPAYHIAFYAGSGDPDRLIHAQWGGGTLGGCASGSWRCDEIDSGPGVGQYPSLALDGSGQPRIAYHHGATTGLRYAEKNGSAWTIREVLPVNSGKYASLAVDVNNGDLPHIAHYNPSTGNLGYAVLVGSNGNCGFNSSSTKFEWQCDEIDDMGNFPHTRDVALALDDFGYPIIAYHKYTISGIHTYASLDVARPIAAIGLPTGNCGPQNTWHCEMIKRTGHPGDYLAIDVWRGEIRIAFLGSYLFGGLNLARLPAGTRFLPLVSKSYAAP